MIIVFLVLIVKIFYSQEDYFNGLCGLMSKKDCESGYCVWENDTCVFDSCYIKRNYGDDKCPENCEKVGKGVSWDFLGKLCRREGAYVDYCFLKYSVLNYDGDMTLCQSDSNCEVVSMPDGFTDIASVYFGTYRLCLTKDRGVGNHKIGTYNYDIFCGIFPAKYCNGGPCIWSNNKCVFDECVTEVGDNTIKCEEGCSLHTYKFPDNNGEMYFCLTTGKQFDSCFERYTYYDDTYYDNMLLNDCKKNSSCTTIDAPFYVQYHFDMTKICVLKDGTPYENGTPSESGLIENKRFGLVLVLLLFFFVLI
jgi:hypothetical protein